MLFTWALLNRSIIKYNISRMGGYKNRPDDKRGGKRDGAGNFSLFKGETVATSFTVPKIHKEEIRKRCLEIIMEYADNIPDKKDD